MTITDLIKILQASIGPVVLISGVGLLLLSLTNRLGRSTDRIRILCQEIRKNLSLDISQSTKQIEILYTRCQTLRMSIIFAILAIVCVSIIILALFSIYIFQINFIGLVEFLFSSGLIALIFSLLFFLHDIFLSLNSLKIEIDQTIESAVKNQQ